MNGKGVAGLPQCPELSVRARPAPNCDPFCLWHLPEPLEHRPWSDPSPGPQFHLLQGLAHKSPWEVFAD